MADAHALPAPAAVTVEARDADGAVVTSVAEDGAVELTVSVDRGRGNTAATGEALTVALSLAPSDPAQAATYRLAPNRLDLPAVLPPDGKQSASTVVRLEALADEFVNDDRLTLDLVTTGQAAYGAGSVDGSFEIEVRDTTVKQIAPRPDAAVKQAFDAASTPAAGTGGLNPGETFSVAVGELFDVLATGSTVAYSASSSRPAVQVVGVEHRRDGDRGLGRQRRRARHRAGDRFTFRRPPDPLGRKRRSSTPSPSPTCRLQVT